jgi:hypothetical protein
LMKRTPFQNRKPGGSVGNLRKIDEENAISESEIGWVGGQSWRMHMRMHHGWRTWQTCRCHSAPRHSALYSAPLPLLVSRRGRPGGSGSAGRGAAAAAPGGPPGGGGRARWVSTYTCIYMYICIYIHVYTRRGTRVCPLECLWQPCCCEAARQAVRASVAVCCLGAPCHTQASMRAWAGHLLPYGSCHCMSTHES